MITNQQPSQRKIFAKASTLQRLIAVIVFILIAAFFSMLYIDVIGLIDIAALTGPCGLKQIYHIPCPTCSWTTAAFLFVQGHIFQAFFAQPAAALFCCLLTIAAFLAFLTAVFGIYFISLKNFFAQIGVRYLILAIVLIVVAGWAVTLVRALAPGK